MKIQCDACHNHEASFYCVADEAALCSACDHRVHHANKLASKHQRFSLLQPPAKQGPLCDICQERNGFFFCQQDRAILCRECDVPIHKANEHTQKHNRFLLTGVKLSTTSAVYSSSSSSSSSSSPSSSSSSSSSTVALSANSPSNLKSQNSRIQPAVIPPPAVVSPAIHNPLSKPTNKPPISSTVQEVTAAIKGTGNGQLMNGGGNGSTTSSILEYLEMLPWYHVEELLDSSHGLCKIGLSDAFPQTLHLQANQNPDFSAATIAFGDQIGFEDSINEVASTKASREWRNDNNNNNSFAVPQPQINRPPTTFKRLRTSY
ncbi:PREDICTED: B-box zinc finger protein 20-like [Ipomoea nil]|uniref:B-box zinc finger protein 20-like n=1 Tax=Ipomoea nil TaxID=35883 RepID=UPI0009012113|nr:PREDICTED: B-box zinc finger protein 20-like [Ipomoea nil]